MRFGILLLLVGVVGAGDLAEVPATPLRNVEVVDRDGVKTRLAGFYRLSGEDLFRGFLGEGEIEVPYERISEVRVLAPAHPAGRMRARITLRSGNEVDATFDEREGEQLFSGYASFGRLTIFFRDIRQMRLLGRTNREDLPDYGAPAQGLDVRVTDREGVVTELIGFRRAVGENAIPGTLGSASIAVPLRIVKRLQVDATEDGTDLRATAALRDGTTLDFLLPSYVEETAYRGEAEFGTFRIHLGKTREIVVHRETPVLRELAPLEAAEGREEEPEGRPQR